MPGLGDAVLKRFLELVSIDSPSFHEAAMCARLVALLREMGVAEVWNDHSGPNTGNLLAVIPARDCESPPIAFCAHTDTVEPGRGVKPRVVVRSDSTTVLGGDNKAAVAAIIEVVRKLLATGRPRPRLELVFTYGEERGHAGAKTVNLSWMQARRCFVPDGGEPIGTIIRAAPSYESIRAVFQGRASHAGIEPEKGVSALVAASAAVLKMGLGRIDEQTTANIGLISGGSARNTVPGEVVLEGEARSLDDARLHLQVAYMHAALEEGANDYGCTVEIDSRREYRAYSLPDDSPVVLHAQRAIERMGLASSLVATGGGADANDFNERGLPSVVLGMGGRQFHTVEENIDVADLGSLADLIEQIITVAAEEMF